MNKLDIAKKKKLDLTINFFEELLWLVEKSRTELKDSPILLRNLIAHEYSPTISNNISGTQNKNILVGILPTLFLDPALFKTNVDLVDFAENVLKIHISRYEKRSRYEIIGLVVCSVPKLNDGELSSLVDALMLITGSKEKLKQVRADKKKANFSWNETIKKLSSGDV